MSPHPNKAIVEAVVPVYMALDHILTHHTSDLSEQEKRLYRERLDTLREVLAANVCGRCLAGLGLWLPGMYPHEKAPGGQLH